jgi:hypothetical protein
MLRDISCSGASKFPRTHFSIHLIHTSFEEANLWSTFTFDQFYVSITKRRHCRQCILRVQFHVEFNSQNMEKNEIGTRFFAFIESSESERRRVSHFVRFRAYQVMIFDP